MHHSPDQPVAELHRLAGAPIARGAREVAGWGVTPDPEAQTLQVLDEHGYDGWLVLVQDTAITADEPAVTSAAMLAVSQSIALNNSAHRTEEIIR